MLRKLSVKMENILFLAPDINVYNKIVVQWLEFLAANREFLGSIPVTTKFSA
jgi:hypothetical protein